MVEKPIVFAIIATAIWFGLSLLALPEMVSNAVTNSHSIILALLIGWLATSLFGVVYQKHLVPLADKTENDLDDQRLSVLRRGVNIIIWMIAFNGLGTSL